VQWAGWALQGRRLSALAYPAGSPLTRARPRLSLQNSINMLIVAPESLPGLVDANLRMPHAAALRVIQLRDDFRAARVGDKSLAALFADP
jgi:hypothetical protein